MQKVNISQRMFFVMCIELRSDTLYRKETAAERPPGRYVRGRIEGTRTTKAFNRNGSV